ncbi:MAG: HAD family hydrolase [Phaeobacter italicus]|jgi:2-haloacid dehalogenase|uniref:HAD family hydrolase n=1 Tax=Phaeobacter italicus TaxID=481446 RepID=UPI00061A0898|nr:HAD family phosphatase [Phaeobacter italicus]MCA0858597.1 HAD family phosphatase [Phaeobacter italicus]
MPIDAVVFDIGRVLIEWDPERFYDSRLGEAERMRLFQEVDLLGMNEGLDRGDDFKSAVYGLAERHPAWADEIRHWHDSWLKMAYAEIPHSVRLLRNLRRAGVPVFALSNFGIGPFELASTVYPFFKEFDQAYVSGYLGTLKPEPEIYEHLERGSKVAPNRLLFTDDRPENIAAAAERGWNTHLFTTPDTLARRLVDEGLLSEEDAT